MSVGRGVMMGAACVKPAGKQEGNDIGGLYLGFFIISERGYIFIGNQQTAIA